MTSVRESEIPMNFRLAVVRDFRDEDWPSMDLCADQLITNLQTFHPNIECYDIAPRFQRFFSKARSISNLGFNCDRLLNRHLLLPRSVSRVANQVDFVHMIDHSYAHLVHASPRHRAGVYCHDLDAFRSILEPEQDSRPWWFRALADRTLNGLKKAAVIFHSTMAMREQLLGNQIASEDRLVHAPLGVAEEFTHVPTAASSCSLELQPPFLLHVGSNIPRKRLDVLLDVFAEARTHVSDLRLVQVGGPWPHYLEAQLERLNITPFVTQLRDLTRLELAHLYRNASLVLVTSEAEGFGLPIIEALACGATVISSDAPTLREAGGAAVIFLTCGNVAEWSEMVIEILRNPTIAPPLESRLAHAARFSWREHARVIAESYRNLAERQECAE